MAEELINSAAMFSLAIDGTADSGAEVFFQPGLYGDFARLAHPHKTDVWLAGIGHVSDRAARAWMAGDAAAPDDVSATVFLTILRRCRRK